MHVEVVTNVTPGFDDSEAEIPISDLEKAWSIGQEEGLWYMYLGNVTGHRWENTYCHNCGGLPIERYVFDIIKNMIKDGRCPKCNTVIPGRFSC